ncbi:hypothetical protein tinsulaeT_16790 [Thalassotalea insulae]|uniref:Leucine-rich repeat domain-containing protein n=1 Tax=Thalassotalea insulae TaxID=2056778 RepID=A0ABQ6GT56_9GAMM|nr:hypothetical protein [Thalassotalea insulae]GLX78339.1 hypothetical protein tinsulaeT_16790 [Thalassotalea insulae]
MINIKKWLWVLFIPYLVSAEVIIKDIKFKDPAFAACVHQTAEKNNWHSAYDVTRLKCHSMEITNAQEVTQFSNLTYLSLYNNALSNLDLTSLNNLMELNLANNQLEQLKIQGLSHLQKLFLFRNRLKTINLQGLNELHTIRLMQNRLTTLDITPLLKLKTGYFFDNKLEDLSITGLKQLEFLDVRQNPMPDELYDFYDKQEGIVISHDGNADDWK